MTSTVEVRKIQEILDDYTIDPYSRLGKIRELLGPESLRDTMWSASLFLKEAEMHWDDDEPSKVVLVGPGNGINGDTFCVWEPKYGSIRNLSKESLYLTGEVWKIEPDYEVEENVTLVKDKDGDTWELIDGCWVEGATHEIREMRRPFVGEGWTELDDEWAPYTPINKEE